MAKDMFWDHNSKTLLKGLLEKHGKDYLEKEMEIASETVQEAILANSKSIMER